MCLVPSARGTVAAKLQYTVLRRHSSSSSSNRGRNKATLPKRSDEGSRLVQTHHPTILFRRIMAAMGSVLPSALPTSDPPPSLPLGSW